MFVPIMPPDLFALYANAPSEEQAELLLAQACNDAVAELRRVAVMYRQSEQNNRTP